MSSPAPTDDDHGSVHLLIRQDILSGALPTGARLKVSDLVARYAAGINPVREALQQLRGEGLVVIEANRGARVREIGPDFVRDIVEMETLIEPFLTAWFVGVATPADIADLEAVQAEIEALSVEDRNAKSRLDERFHRIIYDRHYNRRAVASWHAHREIIRLIARKYPFSAARLRQTNEEHRAIISAIDRHDSAAAADWARQHAEMSGQNLVDQMRIAALRQAG